MVPPRTHSLRNSFETTCTQQMLPAGVYSRELKTSAEEPRVARQLADLARRRQIGRRRGGERRWPGASAPTRSSIQRGMHLESTPWSSGSARLRVRLFGAPAGEGGSRRCVHHTLPDVSGRFTRACRWQRSWQIFSRQTLNKNEPFNSWPPSIRPSLRSLPVLSFSLSLSLS